MIIFKAVKAHSKVYNALAMGMANSGVCELVVDKNIVASISPGQETEVEIEPGEHKIYCKTAFTLVKSNKLTINVNHTQDYIIETKRDIQGLSGSFQRKNPSSDSGFLFVNTVKAKSIDQI